MVTIKKIDDFRDSDPSICEARRAYNATSTTEWDTRVGRAGRQLEDKAADLPERLSSYLKSGKLVLVIGAGVSSSCGLPSWSSLIDKLTEGILAGGEMRADEAQSVLNSVTFRSNPLALTQALTSVATEDQLRSAVDKEIRRARFRRSALLRIVGDVLQEQHRRGDGPTTVLNFNYDRLIERELSARGVPVVSLGRGADFSDLRNGMVNCWHLHGMIGDDEPPVAGDSTIVLTEASYGDAYLNLEQDPLSVLLGENRFPLFVGFSFNDSYVRQILLRASISAERRPVAAGLVPEGSLVDKNHPTGALTVKKIHHELGMAQDPSHNLREGAYKRVLIRNDTIGKMPFWFSRWVLSAIGVEWWQVASNRQVPRALSKLLKADS